MQFNWCNYLWRCEMEGGRIIHSEFPWYWYSGSENVLVRMRNGEMHLYCKENPREIEYKDKVFNPRYEVATMRSIKAFDYGTFSCEIKLPKGTHLWPSFWLSGAGNWPPEIDIMEAWLDKGSYLKFLSWKTTTNVHYRNDDMEHAHIGSKNISWFKQAHNPADEFIKYEVIWKPDSITFKVNDKVVRTVKQSICKKLVENLHDVDKGHKMNVIFNVWCDNPENAKISQESPMVIRNFKYEPMK